jgi:hypothetical protein
MVWKNSPRCRGRNARSLSPQKALGGAVTAISCPRRNQTPALEPPELIAQNGWENGRWTIAERGSGPFGTVAN